MAKPKKADYYVKKVKTIKSKLKKYLSKEEIKALLKRKELIIKRIKQLIKEKGEEAVLFS